MLRNIITACLLGALLFGACKKKDDSPENTFVINGIHDINFTAPGYNYLDLTVKHVSGLQERVTITVTGLPSGVTADIVPASGTPEFFSVIRFTLDGNAAEGTYLIKIVGTAASYSKSYELNLVVPPFNGFIVNGMKYRTANTLRDMSEFFIGSNDHNGAGLICSANGPLPTADGVYTYELEEVPSAANSMSLTYFEGSPNYFLSGTPGKTATVKISGARLSVTIPTVTLSSHTGDQKEVSATVSE